MNMNFKRKLPIPMEIKEQYPITYELEQMKEKRDQEIKSIFEGRDDRFILIIGPCSADNDDSVIDYIDGYLEIELELFGLNIDGTDKDEYLRKRRIKLGVPKDILGYFQYNKGRYEDGTTITPIVEAMQVNTSFQDKHFFMGRDGIYFRII